MLFDAISDAFEWCFDHPLLVVGGIVALLVAVVVLAVKSEHSFQQWAVEQHCVEIDRRPNPPIYIHVGNMLIPSEQGDSIKYRCDGGVEVWHD